MKDNIGTQPTTEWMPIGCKRERARPMTRWDDEIIKFMGVTWNRTAQNRKLWKIQGEAFVQPVADIRGGRGGDRPPPSDGREKIFCLIFSLSCFRSVVFLL